MGILRSAALFVAASVACVVPAGGRAEADAVVVVIDKASQRMSVAIEGRTRYVWPVSTGRSGSRTIAGCRRS